MKKTSILFFLVLILFFPICVFSQQNTAALRNYVGLVNKVYHPGVIEYLENMRDRLSRQGERNAVRALESLISGVTGSGFLYSDSNRNLYVITNHHVIVQAHTLSITFESSDGTIKKIDNLRVIASDEENDLAILAIPPGEAPVTEGLRFATRQINEGEDVFSAGFPGLGLETFWQFGRGTVSNASVRIPSSYLSDTVIGPFIQHTAQVDPGNSGGPLLVTQQNVPTGYAVAGINTLSALRRQAANYAIPVNTAQTFIENALNPRPETYRAALDEQLRKFTNGFISNRAVYPHIAGFLSTACIGENAISATNELSRRGSISVRGAFNTMFENSITGALAYAVAWTIEDSVRSGGAMTASVNEVTGSGEEYTVVFTINGRNVNSRWIREFGYWRIRSFGTVAAGN